MGKEEEVSEVKVAVENGVVPVGKEGHSVADNTNDAKDGLKAMEEEKVETKMDVDNEETGELEKDDVPEDSESKEKKEDEEPKSQAVEEENGAKSEEENKDKVESAPGLSADNESADKDVEKKVSKRKRGKEKPKADEEKTKNKKTVETKKEEPKTPVAPASDRPVRERKSVERLVATIEKDSGKEFHIEKGRGTALKDIPNVAYKLSRKKSEETSKLLHTILFGRRGKASQIKSNISQFSGFVWHDNEDKQKHKIKEKLDKCVKEKLLEFCDVLDLPVAKATTKKEDIVTKLFEFLEAPQATTSELLADKELSSKGNKRKRSSKSESAPSKSSAKSRKRNANASRGEGKEDALETDDNQEEDDAVHGEQENVDGSSDGSEDEKPERAKSEEKAADTGADSEEETKKSKRVSSKKSSVKKNTPEKAKSKKASTVQKSSSTPKKTPSRSSSSHPKVHDSDTTPKTFTRKKKTEAVKEKSPTPTKSASKGITGKKVLKGKEKKPKVEKLKPTDAELKIAICEILKEVDFNTATFTDILKLLGERFNADLVPRKTTIKHMIQDELTKLAEEEDEEEDEEVEALKDDKQASGPGVKV